MMDTATLESLLARNNELLSSIYVAQLWIVGVGVAVAVLLLLYNFLRKFY